MSKGVDIKNNFFFAYFANFKNSLFVNSNRFKLLNHFNSFELT